MDWSHHRPCSRLTIPSRDDLHHQVLATQTERGVEEGQVRYASVLCVIFIEFIGGQPPGLAVKDGDLVGGSWHSVQCERRGGRLLLNTV